MPSEARAACRPSSNPAPSLEAIHRDYGERVSRLCRRMIRDQEAARDAAQEVWLELVRSLPGYDGRSAFSTWLWTVAQRTVWRHLNKEKVYSTRFLRELFALREGDGLEEMSRIAVEDRMAWVRLQCDECLTGILHCVQNEERFIYLLRTLGRLSFAEIADVVGKGEATVRQSHSRAARKLRNFLDSECMLYNPKGRCRCRMKKPILAVDRKGEAKRVRELSRRILFMEAAESFHPPREYWRGLLETSKRAGKKKR